MKSIALLAALGLMIGPAHATFELADPAKEILEEQNEPGYGESDTQLRENEFCVIVVEDDQCYCIHKETKDKILLTDEECLVIVSPPEKTEEP